MDPSPSPSSQPPSLVDPSKLFVGGITGDMGEGALEEYFCKYGDVKEVVLVRESATGRLRGFGFVEFFDPEAAKRAINDEGQHIIGNRPVEVKKARRKSEERRNYRSPYHQYPEQNTHGMEGLGRNGTNTRKNDENSVLQKIFVGGLSSNITEDEFRNYFEKFGCINDVVIMYDGATHRPRGFGFITFDTKEAVDNVLRQSFHELNKKLVEVKRAVPKDGNHHNNGSHCSEINGSFRADGGRMTSYGDYLHGAYTPYGPRYGHFYSYAPHPGPSYVFGPVGYAGGYNYAGYGGIGYGAPYASPRGTWNGHGLMATRSSHVHYPSIGFHPAYMNRGPGDFMGMAAGGYHGAVWSSNGQSTPTGADLHRTQFEHGRPSDVENDRVYDAQ